MYFYVSSFIVIAVELFLLWPILSCLCVRLNAAAIGHLCDTSFVPEQIMLLSCWLCARPLDFCDIFDVIYTHVWYELTMLCLRVFWVSTTTAWSPLWRRPQNMERCAVGYNRHLHERMTIVIFDMLYNEHLCETFLLLLWRHALLSQWRYFAINDVYNNTQSSHELFYALLSTCKTRL